MVEEKAKTTTDSNVLLPSLFNNEIDCKLTIVLLSPTYIFCFNCLELLSILSCKRLSGGGKSTNNNRQ